MGDDSYENGYGDRPVYGLYTEYMEADEHDVEEEEEAEAEAEAGEERCVEL